MKVSNSLHCTWRPKTLSGLFILVLPQQVLGCTFESKKYKCQFLLIFSSKTMLMYGGGVSQNHENVLTWYMNGTLVNDRNCRDFFFRPSHGCFSSTSQQHPPWWRLCKEMEEKMVFCYQNCSDLQWKEIVLVIEKTFELRGWRLRICKYFKITRTICYKSERSEQFLVTECFF